MNLTAGYPFWMIKDGLPYAYPKLLENTNTHVVIVGGGISGALTAYHLTQAGIETILADGRSIGLGSTCASTSLLQYELDEPLHLLKKKVGEGPARRAYQLCGDSIDKLISLMIDIGFDDYDACDSIFFSGHASEKKLIVRECRERLHAGFQVYVLDKKEMMDQYGMVGEYAILSEKGATVDAYAFTHALLQHSIKKGLKVYDRTKISEIKFQSSGLELTTEDGFRIRAANMVNATGFEVVNFISRKIVDLYCTYATVSENRKEKDHPWRKNTMFWNTDDPYIYARLTRDNRLMVGGRDERYSNSASRNLYEKKAAQLCKDIGQVFPKIEFRPEFSWSGTFGKTKDSLPYIGRYPKTPFVYYALGFGGNGITFSQIAAEMIRDMILGKNNADAEIFSFERKDR
jgi:glycine/D-amino acid oxidase-like deaminating enzyme